jgi:hypothetical protein
MKSGFFAFVALSAFAFPYASFAAPKPPALKPYSYRLKLPATPASCANHAQAVAVDFAKSATKAQSVQGICQNRQTLTSASGETYEIDTILINYLAPTEQVPNRAIFGGNSHSYFDKSDAEAGIFATHAECVAAIVPQAEIFEAETGLSPFAGYCQASTHALYPGFSMTLESHGELKKRKLYTFSLDGRPDYGTDGAQITDAALVAIQATGARVAWSNARRVFYYAEYPIQISTRSLGSFDEEAQCALQVDAARSIYVKVGMQSVSAFCLVSPPPGNIEEGKDSHVLFAVSSGHDMSWDSSAERYSTFDECMGDLDRHLKNAASNGIDVLGGICAPNHYSQGGFDARVYRKLL